MIARIEGILLHRDMQRVLVDVHGVGYEIEVPLTTLTGLPDPGHVVVLHTHLLVREDAHTLFGFAGQRDRDLFRRLIRVSGIGARLALAMLSTMAADELAGTIAGHHVLALTRVPGIGKRTAERIVLELGERLQDMGFGSPTAATTQSGAADIERDAAAALEALGYRAADIERMLAGVRGQAERTEDLVRLALRATLRS